MSMRQARELRGGVRALNRSDRTRLQCTVTGSDALTAGLTAVAQSAPFAAEQVGRKLRDNGAAERGDLAGAGYAVRRSSSDTHDTHYTWLLAELPLQVRDR